MNALLSLGYTWLLTRVNARAEAAGYEIYLGGLHEYRPGRPSLGCDLIEPLRVPAVDRWVVATCGQGELSPHDFRSEEAGGFRLHPAAFGRTLVSWERHWSGGRLDAILQQWLDALAEFLRGRDVPEPAPESPVGDL